MKGKTYLPGTRKWRAYLHDAFDSVIEFEELSVMYGIHELIGYGSPTLAWLDNPYIEGSDNVKDFRRIDEPTQKSS